ncbi:MAG: glycosyltransferase, partial [Blastocatellia bacterium]|nr:glycosyltransferase [Blastocatellia bacterium]
AEIVGVQAAAKSREYDWETEVEAKFRRVTLYPDDTARRADCRQRMSTSLGDARPDVVAIPGWSDQAAFAALQWCSDTGTPAIVMSESTADDEQRVLWREKIKRRVVALYSTALVGGERHVDYLVQLGMPRERIFQGYDAVDNGYFAREAKKVESRKAEVEREYGLPENYFLASARFIEKKNLLRLLKAYSEYRKQAEVESRKAKVERWDLVLLGDGPLRESLNAQLSALNLHSHVHLPGFKQYDELPVYYGLANAFVHASTTEQWGLVVNEAMASGLPVIVSNRCGCVPELVHEGVNGYTFDPFNQEHITENLLTMSAMSADQRAEFGRASRQIVAEYDVDRFAGGLKNAAELAIRLPRKRAGGFDRTLLWALMRK